ncbi:MAG: outer membrane protein assembly factor BamB [Burkholderiaceae bacterium]
MRLVFRAAGLLAALALTGCSSLPSWLGGSSAKSGREPAELLDFKTTASVKTVWRASIGKSGEAFLQPAVTENAVYAAAAKGELVRLAPTTGQPVWSVKTEAPIAAGVGSDGFTVAVGTAAGELLAYDAEGKLRWRVALTSELASAPLVGQGLVVVRSSDNRVAAFDAETGKRRWIFQRQSPALTVRLPTALAFAGDFILVGQPNGRLAAVAVSNGAVRWDSAVAEARGATEVERLADVVGAPWVEAGETCAAAFQGRVACFDASAGTLRWSREVDATAGPGGDARQIYVVDAKSTVSAFSRASGASAWKTDKLQWRDVAAPLALKRAVVVGDTKGYVHFLSPDNGDFIARIQLDGAIVVPPQPLAGGALIQTSSGDIALVVVE